MHFKNRLMSTALTIAFDIDNAIWTQRLHAQTFATQHPYLLPVCYCVYFLQKSLQFKSMIDSGRFLHKTVSCFCIFQTPNWGCRKQSPPQVPPPSITLPIRGRGLTECAHWFGLSWYVVQRSSHRMAFFSHLHFDRIFFNTLVSDNCTGLKTSFGL